MAGRTEMRAAELLAIDEARRARILAAETAQAEQNRASKEVGAAKARGEEAEFERLRALVAAKKAEVANLQEEARLQDEALQAALLALPNLPYPDVPAGEDEAGNVEIRRWGTPPKLEFAPLEHYALPAVQAGMDFEAAAKLSGSRFVVLSGAVARLHRALAQFMLDLHTEEHGLTETWTPVLVRDEMMLGTGQLPKFFADSIAPRMAGGLVPIRGGELTTLVARSRLCACRKACPLSLFAAHTQCIPLPRQARRGRDTSRHAPPAPVRRRSNGLVSTHPDGLEPAVPADDALRGNGSGTPRPALRQMLLMHRLRHGVRRSAADPRLERLGSR